MSGATITLSLAEWNERAAAISTLELDVANLKRQLSAAELRDPNGHIAPLVAAMRVAASELIPVAMQYPNKNWPTGALIEFANVLEKMPSADGNDISRAIDMRKFAAEVVAKIGQLGAAPVMPAPEPTPTIDSLTAALAGR